MVLCHNLDPRSSLIPRSFFTFEYLWLETYLLFGLTCLFTQCHSSQSYFSHISYAIALKYYKDKTYCQQSTSWTFKILLCAICIPLMSNHFTVLQRPAPLALFISNQSQMCRQFALTFIFFDRRHFLLTV